MAVHVTSHQQSMFDDATKQVRGSIGKMCEDVRDKMLERANEIYTNMNRDYMTIIGGVKAGNLLDNMSWQERSARRDVDDAIGRADEYFQKIVDADVEVLRKAKAEADAKIEDAAELVEDGDEDEDESSNEDDDEDSQDGERSDASEASAKDVSYDEDRDSDAEKQDVAMGDTPPTGRI